MDELAPLDIERNVSHHTSGHFTQIFSFPLTVDLVVVANRKSTLTIRIAIPFRI